MKTIEVKIIFLSFFVSQIILMYIERDTINKTLFTSCLFRISLRTCKMGKEEHVKCNCPCPFCFVPIFNFENKYLHFGDILSDYLTMRNTITYGMALRA